MSNFLQRISILFCLIFIISTGKFAIAQDANRVDPKANLEALSQKFEAEFIQNRAKALDLAKKNGWVVRQVDSSGNVTELMGVDESGIPIYYSTGNASAARTIRTNQVYPGGGFGLNLTGKYYTLGIWDGGAVRVSHKDFGGRVIYKDTVRTIASHPTHVAGTMIASGRTPNARGMAYEANLWAYSWDNDLAEMATAASNDLIISNHSYGMLYGWKKNDVTNEYEWYGDTTISETIDYHYGFYSNRSKNIDELGFSAKDYLMVFAAHNTRIYDPPSLNIRHKVFYNGTAFYSTKTRASNNNFDCLNDVGVAKNVLTVGAVNPLANYTKPSDVVMSTFSAWGPTDDGRIKPDIVGDGVGVYSTDFQNDSAYGVKSGTSMASPSVSGSLLLIQNQYNLNTGKFLSAAALKAIAIHTADEAGPDTGPDYQFGWGLMNTKKAVDLINNPEGLHKIKENILFKNTTLDFPIETDGNSGYKITVVWTDPAGTVSSPSLNSRTPKLVNDLDVRVIDLSDGETHYPWRLDPNNPADAATRGDNFRDNVEVIDIPYLPSSNYVIRISHKGQLANNQVFSTIITKFPIVVPVPDIDVNNLTICPGKSVQFINTTPNIDFFTKYTWSFPGGVPSSYVGKTPPPVTYNQPGKYSVVLIGNNGPFTKSTIRSEYITVEDPKPGSATLSQKCQFDLIRIDTIGNFKLSKLDWYVNNIKIKSTTGYSSIYTIDLNNGDIVKAVIEAVSDCNTKYIIETPAIVAFKTITLNPEIGITSNTDQFCANSKIIFTANTVHQSDDDYYLWYLDGKYFAGTSKNTLEYNNYEDDDYEIYCIITAQNDCSDPITDTSNTLKIKSTEVSTASVSIAADRTNICNFDLVSTQLTTNVPEFGRQVDWYKNDEFIVGMATVFNTTYVDGDRVYCKVTTTNPCLGATVFTSNVITFKGAEKVTPTVSIEASSTNVCEGTQVTFYATPFEGAIDPVYIWYHNEVEVQNGFNATWSANNFEDGDMVYCMIYPQQCSVREYAYSNPIYINIRERFSELSISVPDTAICTGTEVTFTATLTNPGIQPNYRWKINGVSQGNRGGPTFITSTLNNGDIVECEVQQSGTCAIQLGPYSNKIKMTVYQNTAPTLKIETISGVCSNDNIVFRANATHSNANTTYQWIVNGSTKQNSKSNIFSSASLQENDFVYCIMFTNSACATSNTATSNIIQIKLQSSFEPTIRIEQRALNLCENQPIEFYLYSSDTDPTTTYSWQINGQTVQVNNDKSSFITSDLKNNDVVACLLTSQNKCLEVQEIFSNDISIEIVNATPKIRIESTLFCKGTLPTFYAISSDVPEGSRYYWMKNGSYEQTGEDSTFIPPFYQEGDVISCTLFPKACPGDEINSNTITIPAISDIQPSVMINVEGSLCVGKYVTFKAIATDQGLNPIYKWKINRNFVLIGSSNELITADFKDGDLLTCTLISSEPCALGREFLSPTIVIRPETPVDVNLNVLPKFSEVCEGQLQEFIATTSVPSEQLKFSWFIENLLVNDATASTWSSNAISAGNKVSCTVESDQICILTATASKTVDANVKASITPTISIQTNNQTICSGSAALFQATTSNAGAQPIFEWFINDISAQKGMSNQFFTTSLKNNDVVTCVIFPDKICTDEASYLSNPIIITVYDSETSTISIKSISTINCEDGLAEFQADATNVGPFGLFEWKVNNITVQSGSNFNFSTTTLKSGDLVQCNLLRLDGCAGQQEFVSNILTIQLAPKNTPTVTITPNKTTLCSGESLQINVSSTFGGQMPYYKWYLNDSLIFYDDTTVIDLVSLVEGDVIFCELESSETCITTSLVRSNVVTVQFQNAVTPTISISTPNVSICSGQESVFTANFTNGGTEPKFEWKVNNVIVQSSASNNFSSSTLKDGDKVSCTLISNSDCASTNTVNSNEIEVSVNENVVPTVEIVSDATEICSGQSISFTANFTHGGTEPKFEWKVNNVIVQSSASNVFSSTTLKDGDKVSCTLISNSDCASTNTVNSNEIEISVSENVVPAVEIISDITEICAGQNVSFKANFSFGGTEPKFEWKINNVVVQSSASNNFVSDDLIDGDKVSCTMISNSDCASSNIANSNEIEINVIESVVPIVEIVSDVTEICAGQNVSFKANFSFGGTAPKFEWKINNVVVQSSASNIFNSTTLKDGDKVSCTLISNSDCASTNTVNSNEIEISVSENVVPAVEIISDITEICAGQNVSFKANYSYGGTEPIFEWKVNGSIVQSSASNNFVSDDLVDGDKVSCTMISNSDCASSNIANSNEIEINVIESVLPIVEIVSDVTEICAGQNVSFKANFSFGGTEPIFEWKVNNVVVQSSASNNFVSDDLADGDKVTCTMISNSDCASTNTANSNEIEINVIESVLPTVEIVSDVTEICAGQNVSFKANFSFGGTEPKFEWKVNNVVVQSSASNIFNSTTLKDVDKVSCTLISNSDCASTNTVNSNEIEITVSESVVPTVEIISDVAEICAGQNVSFKANFSFGGNEPKFEWKVNNVVVQNSTSNNFSSSTLKDGDKVSCTLISNSDCASTNTANSNEIEISESENVVPTVEIISDVTEICSGQNVSFKANFSFGGTEPKFEWKVNNVIIQSSTSNNFSSSTLKDGDKVSCTLISNSDCASTNTVNSNEIEITVSENVVPTVEIVSDATEICAGQNVSFKANFSFGGTEPKFEWKVNNVIVQSSTSNNFSSSILKDGDKVSCTLISNSDCASTNTVNSNTIEIQVKTAIQPSIQLNYIDDTLCREANLKLELIAQNLGAGTVYHWFKNGELVGQNAVLNIDSLMQGDEIWCNITTQAVNCGIEVSAISDTFQANVYPTPIFEVYQKGDTLFATEGFAAYSWFFNGRMIALGPDHFIVPEEPGIYTANVSDPNGCSGISVSINFVVTSIQNSINEAFKIYPNPSSGKIYMQFVRPTDGVIRMFQANGQQVLQPILIQGVLQYSIDISDFPSGMYMIMLEDSENIWSEKIIKMD